MVLYFYSFTDETVAERTNTDTFGGIMTGTVGSLVPFAGYNYRWFNPITGEYAGDGSFKASAAGTRFAGPRPDDTDYVLVIEKDT
jgi:hypothetical protein